MLRLMLDSDLSSRPLAHFLADERGHDVLAAGFRDDLEQLDDPILFALAQQEQRIMITHNFHDYPDVLRQYGEAGRSHRGCIISYIPTNVYREMMSRLDRWLAAFPRNDDWIDRGVSL